MRLAQELAQSDERYVMLYQYGNEANPRAHYEGTALEIIQDLPDLDVFVAGHRPIYGKQMLYFFDDVLRVRAEMPPPKCLPNLLPGGDHKPADESEAAPLDAVFAGGPEREQNRDLRESGPMQIPQQRSPGARQRQL